MAFLPHGGTASLPLPQEAAGPRSSPATCPLYGLWAASGQGLSLPQFGCVTNRSGIWGSDKVQDLVGFVTKHAPNDFLAEET